MDNLTPKQRSAQMSLIKSTNTKPEIIVRKHIFSLGYRYRIHCKDLPGNPDIVFRAMKKIVFVNGCFWHGHKCKLGRIPKTKVKFWTNKISNNNKRDKTNLKKLKNDGWSCIVIWECQIKSNKWKNKIEGFLKNEFN